MQATVGPGVYGIQELSPGRNCPNSLGQCRGRELRESEKSRQLKAAQKHETDAKPGNAFFFHPLFPFAVSNGSSRIKTTFQPKRFQDVNCKT